MYSDELTISTEEAAKWSGIGINRLRDVMNTRDCPFVIYIGKRKRVKTAAFKRWVESSYSI